MDGFATFCEFVLGKHEDRIGPLQGTSAFISRSLGSICLISGAIAILLSSGRGAETLNYSQGSIRYFIQAALPLALAGLHLLYLSVVLRLLIFDVPSHRLKARSVIIPLLLIFSYVIYAADPYRDQLRLPLVSFKVISSALFICVYTFWALRDWCEASITIGDLRTRRKFWLLADLVICGFLLGDLFHIVDLPRYLTAKDIVVALCLAGYFIVQNTVVATRRDDFVQVYTAYLDAISSAVLTIQGPIANLRGLLSSYTAPSTLSVLDFGSGDGRRLWWFLKEMELLKRPPGSSGDLYILMYDKLPQWQDRRWDQSEEAEPLLRAIESAGWKLTIEYTASFRVVKKKASRIDILHASHSVYDRRALREISKLVKRSKSGAVVALRGIGSSIFRRMSEGVCLIDPRTRQLSYLWNTYFINTINSKQLEYLNGADGSCVVIDQHITDAGRISRLGDFMRSLYVAEWTERLDGLYHAALSHERFDGGLNNQDWIVFLKKT